MPTAEQRFVSFPNKYGPYVETVGKNKRTIAEYIRNQPQEDLAYEQMSIKEWVDPFTGEPVKTSKK